MEKTETLIMDARQIEHKIRRMAYQIYEYNSAETELVLAGIMNSGYELAKRMERVLTEIAEFDVQLCQVEINKRAPLDPIRCSLSAEDCRNKVVVLVDDVLNSGSTLIYGARYFLDVPLKKLQTVVLVDRSHKRYPIKADFRGVYLSTSLNETVKVTFGDEDKVELI